jgi:SAM-dependent methyltransferase
MRHEVIDVKAVDWNRVWRALHAKSRSSKRDSHFWDKRAPSFAKAVSETDYADQFLAIVKPEAHWTVLDMGCGSGTLAVPLAKRVSSVTAVDFSGEMLAVVRDRCEAEGIRNITTIHGRWEDDWEKFGIDGYDVAIASRSLAVDDLHAAILKLNAVARKRVCIVTVVGDGPHDRRLFDAVGRPLNVGPDYIYNYNMLYQMGICANVAFIEERRNRTYDSPEEAAESMHWMFDELNPHEEEKLAAYLKEHLVYRSGSWRLSYDKRILWAVIWWEKE